MLSDLQRRKLERRFALYDVSENGLVDQDDFDLAAQRVARAFNRAPGMPGYRAILNSFRQQWQQLKAAVDGNDDNTVTLDEYLTAMTKIVISDSTGYARVIQPSVQAMMEIADTDHDDQLTAEEFYCMMRAYRVTATAAAASFARLDHDRKGYLTRTEIDQAFAEFFMSDDPDLPGNWLFGPL